MPVAQARAEAMAAAAVESSRTWRLTPDPSGFCSVKFQSSGAEFWAQERALVLARCVVHDAHRSLRPPQDLRAIAIRHRSHAARAGNRFHRVFDCRTSATARNETRRAAVCDVCEACEAEDVPHTVAAG